MKQKRLVCLCNQVSELEIKKTLRAGAVSSSEIQKFSSAGTHCGRCLMEIDAMVEKHIAKTSKDPQLRIKF